MVTEDNQSLNAVLVTKMNSEGFTVYHTFNGKEALEIVYDKKPDLILLDLFMPIYDGYNFLKSLRQDVWEKNARIIILTNTSLADDKVIELIEQEKPLSFLVETSTKLQDLVSHVNEALVTV